ncbi:MAG: U32 family peptidase [Endomicrobium sp.]|jgi:putative protease|nr:U32 family peptidase [Endomicrobium sp.]
MKKIEILAPAGSKEAFIAAIEAGADAVYCGLRDFSARSKAGNFTTAEFFNYVNYAHKNNVKVYAAFNTLIKQNELKKALNCINAIAQAQADAVIVQDFGIANIIKNYFPKLNIHSSTQMALHNSYGVLQAQKAGFKRVVLARELSLNDIKTISQKTSAELEIFCHGALCFSVSGLCLMSSFIGGLSGNRGNCAQPCRRKWNFKNKEGFYISPKDLDLSAYIKELKNSGISSLKIEGRMKSAQYVYKTVKAYKMLVSSDDDKNIFEAGNLLSQDFARQKTTFNFAQKSRDIFTPEIPKQLGAWLGKIEEAQNRSIKIKTVREIRENDILKAADAKKDAYFKIKILSLHKNGDEYEIETDSPALKRGMDIFKTSDGNFEEKIKSIISKKEPDKKPFTIEEKILNMPSFHISREKKELFLRFNDCSWLSLIKENASLIFMLEKENLKISETLKDINYFELPPFIEETDLTIFQKTINMLIKRGNKKFFINNISHFRFFENANTELNAGQFLYVLNAYAADFLFKNKINLFSFSAEDDIKNISDLCKTGLANRAIFYLSGFPALALSSMRPHEDLQSGGELNSSKDSFKIICKNGKTYILPQYPVMLFNKKRLLEKNGINKFLIDFSFIAPNKNYFSSIINAYHGKMPLQNDYEFNFERGLK